MPVVRSRAWRAALVLAAGAACGDGGPAMPAVPAVVITTAAVLPAATVGGAYDVTLAATGGSGSMAWRVAAGALPSGLQLSAAGQVSGTPALAGGYGFTVEAASSGRSATLALTLRVDEAPLRILTIVLPNAILGSAYSRFLDVEAGDGQAAWSVVSGSLPAGVALSTAGVLTGNPGRLGVATFRVRVTRGARAGERDLTLTVDPPPLAITTSTLPPAEQGLAYEAQLEATGGVGGNTWSLVAGRLPLGLTMGATGLVTGTATAVETRGFTVQLASGTQAVSRQLVLAVGPTSYVASAVVDMPADAFTPFLVKLVAGGTVTWRFPARQHNVIFGAVPGVPADINITSNVEVARIFMTPGLFRYDCTIHPGMSGQVAVR